MDPYTVPSSDQVRRFIFEKQPVRGHWVRLEGAWRELRAHADYPPVVSELLGEAVAASVLLAATLKFRGTLTFQLQGNGAVGLLVAQCAHDFRVRAVARCAGVALGGLSGDSRRGAIFRRLVGTEGRGVLQEQGAVTVTCEFCHRPYRFDAADVEALFAEDPADGSQVIH